MDEEFPDCCCEQISVSAYSPGPINPNERLASVIPRSKYYHPKTKVILPTIGDRIFNGLSVDRILHTNKSDFKERGNKIVSKDAEKNFHGAISFSTSTLRSIYYKGHRCFAVYDTALKENKSHAEIVQTNIPKEGNKRQRKEIRSSIRSRITNAIEFEGKMVSVDKIFS